MHWKHAEQILPLYVGKAEKVGRKHAISTNLRTIRSNLGFFGRWGYRPAYHIGDLSLAIFGGQSYKQADPKYRRWADRLFLTQNPPVLRERVYVALIGWECGMRGPSEMMGSVAAVEKEVIALASVEHPTTLLNIDGT